METHIPPDRGKETPQGAGAFPEKDARRLPVGAADRKERALVWLLSGIAAVRVFVFSAAFPFFSNVDEQAQFDLVVRYSHGEVPRRLVAISEESGRYIALYGSPEDFFGPETFPGGRISRPLWTLPRAELGPRLSVRTAQEQAVTNHEALQAPLYYAAAGVWLRLGESCGMRGGFLLYWIRFLNIVPAVALVWIGWAAGRLVFPEREAVRVGLPLLLAFFPQDTFYSIQSDVLSPLFFGLAFIGLLKLLRADAPGRWPAALTGLALAATVLVKVTNLPLVLVAGGALLLKVVRLARAGRLRTASPALALLTACVIVPLAGWFLWNLCTLGDLTGAAAKMQSHGWTRKPLADWWRHPIFMPAGLWQFGSELMASFWRGEFIWHGERLASRVMDAIYWASSLVLLAAAGGSLFTRSTSVAGPQRQAIRLAFWSFAAPVALLVLTSVAFDFGDCAAPSRAFPFFVAGRLASGAVVPFLLLYLYGLDCILHRAQSSRPQLLILTGLVLLLTVSEIKVNRPVFSSEYNWFHLMREATGQQLGRNGASRVVAETSYAERQRPLLRESFGQPAINLRPGRPAGWRPPPIAESISPGSAECPTVRG